MCVAGTAGVEGQTDRQTDTHNNFPVSHSWLTISKLGCLFCLCIFPIKSLKIFFYPTLKGFLCIISQLSKSGLSYLYRSRFLHCF